MTKKNNDPFGFKKAIDTSVKVELISVDTEEGQQFWNLSGIGAILRFKV